MKHIEIEYQFVREKVLEGSLMVEYLQSQDNLADIFTKPLSKGPFIWLRRLFRLVSTFHFKGGVENVEVEVYGLRRADRRGRAGSTDRFWRLVGSSATSLLAV
ncbi:hypothetical protein KSP39_PZI010906 [Platanthera zijinensis]|uniref:Uncharacterized protein n=1 Tax=Platanthera zijinensis TaxID=2320716 RepID=A0AAP0BG44_9ASPA